MLNLVSGICFVVTGIGLLLRAFGVIKLSSLEKNATWLAKYGKRVKWLAPLCIVLGVFNIVWSVDFQPVTEQLTNSTQNQAEDEQTAREIAEEFSQELPRRFSSDVTFEAVTAIHATLVFKYKLEHSPGSIQKAEEAKAAIETALLKRFCSNDQFRQLMLRIPGRALIVFNDDSKYSEFGFSTVFEQCPRSDL